MQIVEIKRPTHKLTNDEMDRIISYHQNMKSFLDDPGNKELKNIFPDFHITLVCDELALTGAQSAAFEGYMESSLTHINWGTFLWRTRKVHKDFLEEAERQQLLKTKKTDG